MPTYNGSADITKKNSRNTKTILRELFLETIKFWY